MTPRPRSASDEEILEAVDRTIDRHGPHDLTLARVGREAGLAPSTLIQRFGTKRELLLAYARWAADRAPELFEHDDPEESPLEVMERGFLRLVESVVDPSTFANHLSFLLIDVSDPAFRRLACDHQNGVRAAVGSLLERAMDRGELREVDPESLAQSLLTMVNGTMISWALDRRATLQRRVSQEVATLIGPLRM